VNLSELSIDEIRELGQKADVITETLAKASTFGEIPEKLPDATLAIWPVVLENLLS